MPQNHAQNSIKIAIAGPSGRMGRALIDAVLSAPDVQLTGAVSRQTDLVGICAGDLVGHRGGTDVCLTNDIDAALKNASYLIDFTSPEFTLSSLAACQRWGRGMVIGTTGFSALQRKHIEEAAKHIPIVMAPNMSLVNRVILELLEVAAKKLGAAYDVEIFEAHHRHKVDAPSGTSLGMGKTIAQARGQKFEEVAETTGNRNGPRKKETIGFSVVRGGEATGEHTVYFMGAGERLEITHRSTGRAAYAEGAIEACRFLNRRPVADKEMRLWDMRDVFGY